MFSFVHELLNKQQVSSLKWFVPMFPTQHAEKKLGYDFKINNPVYAIFIQFKVPEKIISTRASHWWQMNGIPYYQFLIRPDALSHQHNTLVDLAQVSHNNVYYCSPAFITTSEYNSYYLNEKILQNSMCISCKRLMKISGSDRHSICYRLKPLPTYSMFSEEYPGNAGDFNQIVEEIQNSVPYKNIEEMIEDICIQFGYELRKYEGMESVLMDIAWELFNKKKMVLMVAGKYKPIY
jgi:hypothetical protein